MVDRSGGDGTGSGLYEELVAIEKLHGDTSSMRCEIWI